MLRILIVICIGVVVAGLTIYATTLESSAESRFRVAFFPNVAHAIPVIGMEMGAFEKSVGDQVSLDVRLFDSGPQAIEALFSGSIDMAYVGPGPAINGFLKSTDGSVRIISGAASGGSSFVIHPDSHITQASDLHNTRISAPQIGNSQDISLRHYLTEHGLVPTERGGSVTVLNIANPDTYTLFVKGEIDAAWVPEPWATILVEELGGHRLFYEEELWEDGVFASVVLVARQQFVEENPEAVSSWLEVHNSTAHWIGENPAEAREMFNNYVESELGRAFPDDIIDIALQNIHFTTDTYDTSIEIFAERADALGYLGRNGYNLEGLYMNERQDGPSR
ncbi:MAG: ABC transporter substrate-binding protein [Cenarchaeum sp. SB0665_bin_23]|nr:ABC transporter substrate-binding protein [Cenarchaeum sp. SB0667_bin_13]MXY38137.1 ABC transporter substrate-binding protein [Cenarchaeum sp. SB0664_bin_35]MXY61619.1 ABC transporter substrate-binding protein [Cenarchaeum sp. SB0665_bin_23]MXZ93656.1 ABC transporter substrate-binding protein [Cenarchaeum sp. SB0666_bin_15]MYB47328.1 ABC transporter substrate-binding protein [Cenarchaeum sp. SB0662_bin_33]MYC79996.1 ABC transporter substrate-binding protein [Cenarchaeum sp. SB0661_bin_35]M